MTVSVVNAGAAAIATIVLFPGDISAAREKMLRDPIVAAYSQWSCEALSQLLARRWPRCHAVVMHPPRRSNGFSIYEGWLSRFDETGDPVGGYDGSGTACARLLAELDELQPLLPRLATLPLNLVAFSKGTVCVWIRRVATARCCCSPLPLHTSLLALLDIPAFNSARAGGPQPAPCRDWLPGQPCCCRRRAARPS